MLSKKKMAVIIEVTEIDIPYGFLSISLTGSQVHKPTLTEKCRAAMVMAVHRQCNLDLY